MPINPDRTIESDRTLINAAIDAGWRLDCLTGKWRHPQSSASYVNHDRWGRYACEDHAIDDWPQTK